MQDIVRSLRDTIASIMQESGDALEMLFTIQLNAQQQREQLCSMHSQAFKNQMALALIDEVCEYLRETPWKQQTPQTPAGWRRCGQHNRERALEELADVFHFFINLCLSEGITAQEIFDAYVCKAYENAQRQEGNY